MYFLRSRITFLFSSLGTGHYLCRGGGGGGEKEEGLKAVLDWREGGGKFPFKQLIGGSSFLRFCKGSCLCFCKWDYFYEIN